MAAVDNLGTLFWLDAGVVVQNQTGGTLAAWDAGLETGALYDPEWYVIVEAGNWTGRSTFIKHKAPLQRTANSCRREIRFKKVRLGETD